MDKYHPKGRACKQRLKALMKLNVEVSKAEVTKVWMLSGGFVEGEKEEGADLLLDLWTDVKAKYDVENKEKAKEEKANRARTQKLRGNLVEQR